MSVDTTNIVNYINEIIASAQNDTLTTECPTGTVNDTYVSCASWSTFTGTEGNVDTDGYYAKYTVSIQNMLNVFNIALQNDVNYTSDGKTYATYTTSFTADYISRVTVNMLIHGQCEIYIPETSTSSKVCMVCTSTKCNKCSLKCGCGLTTKSNSCDCSTITVTTPSTYSNNMLVNFPQFPATVTADMVLTGNFTYTVSNENNTELPVKQFYGSLLPNTIYISNLKFSDLLLTASNVDAPIISGWPSVTLSSTMINEILLDITNYLTNYMNNHMNEHVYEVSPDN